MLGPGILIETNRLMLPCPPAGSIPGPAERETAAGGI